MSQVDTTPPEHAIWQPQPEAFPYILDDEQTAPPVPRLYIPSPMPVRQVPSDRVTFASHGLVASEIRRVADASESGIGSRYTITLDPLSKNVSIGESMEALSGPETDLGVFGPFLNNGYRLSVGTTFIPVAIVLQTKAELWVRCSSAGPALVSIMVEQFNGTA